MPPPTKPHDQFMEELSELLLSEGIFDLTMADIAARLKCSRRRLYEIAPTKEELFLKVADLNFRRIREIGWREAAAATGATEKILAYFNYGASFASRMSPKFQRDLEQIQSGRELFDAHQRERVQGLEQFIVDEMRAGGFAKHNARFVAEAAFVLVRKLRDPAFKEAAGVSFEQGLRELWALLLFGLVRRGSESRAVLPSTPVHRESDGSVPKPRRLQRAVRRA